MKKILPILFVAFAFTLAAQTDVILNINHKLGAADFEMDMAASNNMNHPFNVKRLQYYISQITIVHDGGLETPMTDVYILADAANALSENLGNYNVTNVEGIKFHIGIDEAKNHLDPASYRTTHPLGPKAPSMHWGWVSGYRFLAIEGNGGAAFNRLFEIHALGDANYFEVSLDLSATADNATVAIDLDADYTRILEDIAVKDGLIEHSETGLAAKSLENFRDFVFSSAGSSSTKNLTQITAFEVFPNPTSDGQVTVEFNSSEKANYQIQVSNLLGQVLMTQNIQNGKSEVKLNVANKGIHLLNLIEDGEILTTKRLVIE